MCTHKHTHAYYLTAILQVNLD